MGVLIGLSMPTFVLGELLLLVVYLPLNEHGIHGSTPATSGLTQGLIAWVGHMILPWVTLAPVQAAVYTRLSRGSAARHPRRGLHPDGPGEGPDRAARGLPARACAARSPRWCPSSASTSAPCSAASWWWTQVFGLGGLGQACGPAIAIGDLPVILAFVLLAATSWWSPTSWSTCPYAVLDPRVRIS